jgi:hypothetical protein
MRQNAVVGERGKARCVRPVSGAMNKLCIFVGMTVVGSIGWWLGSKVGFMTAFVVSGIGSMIGVYLGWRFNRDYME